MRTSNAICLIDIIRKYDKLISKLEDALGGVILEEYVLVISDVIDVLEDESEKMWDDDIYNLIYDESKTPEEVWGIIQQLES